MKETPQEKGTETVREHERKKREVNGWSEIPPDFPREEEIITDPDAEAEGMKCIGYEISERLARRASSYYVKVIKRAKYADPADPLKGVNMRREFIGIYDSAGKPFWIGMGPKNVGAANFPEIPKGCTFVHNHPNGSTFSTADIIAFIENDMARMVVSVQSKDSAGNVIFHKYTLTKKDSGIKLPLTEIKQRYEKAAQVNDDKFKAWKDALNGRCYEIEFS